MRFLALGAPETLSLLLLVDIAIPVAPAAAIAGILINRPGIYIRVLILIENLLVQQEESIYTAVLEIFGNSR